MLQQGEKFVLGHFTLILLLLANGLSESIKETVFLPCNPEIDHLFLSMKSLRLVSLAMNLEFRKRSLSLGNTLVTFSQPANDSV